MTDATLLKKISPEARARLSQAARDLEVDEDDLVAFVVENAFPPAVDYSDDDRAQDELAIAEADAGGPFVSQVDMLAWLKARSRGERDAPPEATVYLS